MKRFILTKCTNGEVVQKEVDCIRGCKNLFVHYEEDENKKRSYVISHSSGYSIFSFGSQVKRVDVINLYRRLKKLKWSDFLVDSSTTKKRALKRHNEVMENIKLAFYLWKEGLFQRVNSYKPTVGSRELS